MSRAIASPWRHIRSHTPAKSGATNCSDSARLASSKTAPIFANSAASKSSLGRRSWGSFWGSSWGAVRTAGGASTCNTGPGCRWLALRRVRGVNGELGPKACAGSSGGMLRVAGAASFNGNFGAVSTLNTRGALAKGAGSRSLSAACGWTSGTGAWACSLPACPLSARSLSAWGPLMRLGASARRCCRVAMDTPGGGSARHAGAAKAASAARLAALMGGESAAGASSENESVGR
jgi:hypothetical protein